ncbi:MAG: ABC transporter substrate-binding protein [Planctomycetes bacterium]|nr:ABC transporter substrate-binding protein [Planctomycetota bacterium]
MACALVAVGRSFGDAKKVTGNADTNSAETADEAPAEKPFQLGNLITPFTPPPLEEIEKSVEWIDRPVLDGMELLRKKQEAAGSSVTTEEALTLRNDSPEHNEKILTALGRVPPADGAGVDYNSSWVRHVPGDLKSSNPLFISSITEFEFRKMTGFEYLSYDESINYFAPAEYVVSWKSSKDGLMDKIVLRDDVVWSDGRPITADDIKFSFQVIMTDAVIVPAVRTGVDQLKWVEAFDDRTVVFFHKEPLATNTVNIEFPVIPKHVYQKSIAEDPTMARSAYHAKLEDHPIVGGPYELVRRSRNQEFVVRRRENFYKPHGKQVRAKPYFKEIRVKVIEDFNTALVALKGGQIEEMFIRPEQWVNQTNDANFYKRNTKVTAVEWTEFHFIWNTETPFFSDSRVRQAMSFAMDYEELLKVVCQGLYQPARGPYHPTSWMFPKNGPQPYQQDFVQAEKLLDEAGWTDSDGDGIRDKLIDGKRVPFEFTMLTYQTETGVMAATLMKMSLDQIGVICHVKPTEFTVLIDRQQKHRFDAAMAGWGSGTDPDGSRNSYATGEARNSGLYSNRRVDELFEKGLRELDPEKRAAIYGEIHMILWEDQPYTWLFYRNAFYAFSKKVRAYNFAPTGPYLFDPGIHSIYKPVSN